MTALTAGAPLEEEIPDDLFAGLPSDGAEGTGLEDPNLLARAPVTEVAPLTIEPALAPAMPEPTQRAEDALFATLPKLPSIESFTMKLQAIQLSLMEAQAEADSLRLEIQKKAHALRALAGALEAAI